MGRKDNNFLSTDQQAFVIELWNKHSKSLFLYIYKLMGYREEKLDDSKNYLQEVFLKLMDAMLEDRIDKYKIGPGWLYKVAKNLIIDDIRNRGNREVKPLVVEQENGDYENLDIKVEPIGTENIEFIELKGFIIKAILNLPEGQKNVMIEYLRNKSSGMKFIKFENSKRKLLHDARKNLEKALSEYYQSSPFKNNKKGRDANDK